MANQGSKTRYLSAGVGDFGKIEGNLEKYVFLGKRKPKRLPYKPSDSK